MYSKTSIHVWLMANLNFFAKCGGKLEEDAARGPAVCGSWWQSVNQKKIEIMPMPYGHSARAIGRLARIVRVVTR